MTEFKFADEAKPADVTAPVSFKFVDPETPPVTFAFQDTPGERFTKSIAKVGQNVLAEIAGTQEIATDITSSVVSRIQREGLLAGGVADVTPDQEVRIRNAQVPQDPTVIFNQKGLGIDPRGETDYGAFPPAMRGLNPDEIVDAMTVQKRNNEDRIIKEFVEQQRQRPVEPLAFPGVEALIPGLAPVVNALGVDTSVQIEDFRSPDAKAILAQMRKETRPNGNLGFAGEVLFGSLEATLDSVLPSVGFGLVGGKRAGLSFIATTIFTRSYNDARNNGRTAWQAAQDASFFAAAETITESVPLGIMIKRGIPAMRRVLEGIFTEGIQEALVEAINIQYQNGVLDENISFKEAVQQIIMSGVIGGVIGAGGAGVGHVGTTLLEPSRATSVDVLATLAKLLKDADAVDPTITDVTPKEAEQNRPESRAQDPNNIGDPNQAPSAMAAVQALQHQNRRLETLLDRVGSDEGIDESTVTATPNDLGVGTRPVSELNFVAGEQQINTDIHKTVERTGNTKYDPLLHDRGKVIALSSQETSTEIAETPGIRKAILEKSQGFAEAVIQALAPDARAVLQIDTKLPTDTVAALDVFTDDYYLIRINPRSPSLSDIFDRGRIDRLKPDGAAKIGQAISHEIGHLVMHNSFNHASTDMQTRIYSAYERFLVDRTPGESLSDFLVSQGRAEVGIEQTLFGSGALPAQQMLRGELDYWYGFDEWFAEQFARWVPTGSLALPNGVVERWFQGVAGLLQKAREIFKRTFNAEVETAEFFESLRGRPARNWFPFALSAGSGVAQRGVTEDPPTDSIFDPDSIDPIGGGHYQSRTPLGNLEIFLTNGDITARALKVLSPGMRLRLPPLLKKLRRAGLTQAEMELAELAGNRALKGEDGNVDLASFTKELEALFIPLMVETIYSDTYSQETFADFGAFDVGKRLRSRDPASPPQDSAFDRDLARVGFRREGDGNNASTRIYKFPFDHATYVVHYPNFRDYMGHTRVWDHQGERYIAELQSDIARDSISANELKVIQEELEQLTLIENLAALELLSIEGSLLRPVTDTLTDEDVLEFQLSFGARPGDLAQFRTAQFRTFADARSFLLRSMREVQQELNRTRKDIAAVRLELRSPQGLTAAWESMKSTVLNRMLREELRRAARESVPTIRIPTAETLVFIEGWWRKEELDDAYQTEYFEARKEDVAHLNYTLGIGHDPSKSGELHRPSLKKAIKGDRDIAPVFERHEKLVKRFAQEFHGTEIIDPDGFTWIEIHVDKRLATDPVLTHFSKTPGSYSNPVKTALNKLPGIERVEPDVRLVSAELDQWSWFSKHGENLRQVAQKNSHIPGVVKYSELVNLWSQEKTRWHDRATKRLEEINTLPKSQQAILAKFIFEISKLDSWPNETQLGKLVEASGLDSADDGSWNTLTTYVNIKKDFLEFLDALQEAVERDMKDTFRDSPLVLQQQLEKLRKEMNELRARPYFPHTRFPQRNAFTLSIRTDRTRIDDDGKVLEPGDTVFTEFFESERKQKARMAQLRRENPSSQGWLISGGKINQEVGSLMGMPGPILEAMRSRLKLTGAQLDEFNQIVHEFGPSNSFQRRFAKRDRIPGFSKDVPRVYVNYFFHGANHLARAAYGKRLQQAIAEIQASAKEIRLVDNALSNRRDDIAGFMAKHLDYIMSPENDWSGLRAVGFHWWLGAVPASAALNLTQVPLVTFPYLSARYGEVAATAALAKGMASAGLRMKEGFVDVPADEESAMNWGQETGFITESQASELAGISEGLMLRRALASTGIESGIRTAGFLSGWLFSKSELYNRQATFLAAYRLAKAHPDAKFLTDSIEGVWGSTRGGIRPVFAQEIAVMQVRDGITKDEAVARLAAREAVLDTQFEYNRWNRPAFMRGKASVVFLFFQYLQNILWFIGNDPGAWRMLAVLLLFGGLQGMPGAEDAANILKGITRKMGKKFDLFAEAREFFHNIGVNPDLMLHGISRYGFGLNFLGDLMNIPIPSVDMSSNISLGRIIPAVPEAIGSDRPFADAFLEATTDGAGAVAAIPIGAWKAISDSENPDTLRRLEPAMPRALRSIAKAWRYDQQGLRTRSGAQIVDFDRLVPEQAGELFATALGFNPTRVQQEWEKRRLQGEHRRYWVQRRTALLSNYRYALLIRKDKELLADVIKAIATFNADAQKHEPGAKISADTIRRSVTAARNRNAKVRAGQAPGNIGQEAYRRIAEQF